VPEDDGEHERLKDWSTSTLYVYTRETHTRYLLDKLLIRLLPGDNRPATPKEHQGLNKKQIDELIINPQGLKILSEVEAQYMSELLRRKSKTLL
jgi:hypothetical protein